jgi:CelD/BcsL family acetyltransferase involved in cellulose biosynthesis
VIAGPDQRSDCLVTFNWGGALDRDWDELAQSSPGSTVFQSGPWSRAWCAAVSQAEGQRPIIVRIPRVGPLRLGVGLQVSTGSSGMPLISPLASPWIDYQEVVAGDYLEEDIDLAATVIDQLARQMRARLKFDDVKTGGVLAIILEKLDGRSRQSSLVTQIDLADETHVNSLRQRKEVVRKRRRLSRLGKLETRYVRDRSAALEALERFVVLHTAQWKERDNAVAPFTDEVVYRGFRDIAAETAESGHLVIVEMNLDSVPIASYFGFIDRECFLAYRTTFDQSFYAYSPGHVMVSDMLVDLPQLGVRYFDLMRGAYPYKAAYASSTDFNLAWDFASRE